MIFYLAIDANGKTWIKATKEQIKDVNDKEYRQIDIPTDKTGLQVWVQQMLDETVNTTDVMETPEEFFETAELKLPEPPQENVATRLVRFEDEWDQFPLARKFHYAAKAMEEGRDILGGILKGGL